MFRLTQYMKEIRNPTPLRARRRPAGPVVIWNLVRRCNLLCTHCYTNSSDRNFKGELSTDEVFSVMDDLKAYGVPVLILSGGEPLLRPDILDIGKRAKDMGFYTGLSTNGTLIDDARADAITETGFDYVGVSLDGIGKVHDAFRRKEGAFEEALNGIRRCRDRGVKVGVRFCLTRRTDESFPEMMDFLERERIDKFYISHLNYSGRGHTNRESDAHFRMTRRAMDLLIEEAWRCVEEGVPREFVTGNNDADAVYFLQWAEKRFPEKTAHLRAKLERWGGNSTGVNIANIDNLGNVHPDSFWWDYTLDNVRKRPFSEIWEDRSDPLMAGFKAERRKIGGRCGNCSQFGICNGNTRVRAWKLTGDAFAEDPGCYLTDTEIGLEEDGERTPPEAPWLRDSEVRL